MENLVIRPEQPEDYPFAERMVQRAFWNIHGPGCNEHLLVRLIRNHPDYLPQFSRVAELDGKIVGAIYYTRAKLVNEEETVDIVTFGPLAVEPTLQNSGVGRRLLEQTLPLAKQAGFPGVCIYGEPEYYPKRGFRSCREFGVTSPDGSQFDALMVYPFKDAHRVRGKLYESSAFEQCGNGELLAAMEEEFPKYPKIKIQEGFLQIYGCRFASVAAASEKGVSLSYWELTLEAETAPGVSPEPGDTVLFRFRPGKRCLVTQVCRNLL